MEANPTADVTHDAVKALSDGEGVKTAAETAMARAAPADEQSQQLDQLHRRVAALETLIHGAADLAGYGERLDEVERAASVAAPILADVAAFVPHARGLFARIASHFGGKLFG